MYVAWALFSGDRGRPDFLGPRRFLGCVCMPSHRSVAGSRHSSLSGGVLWWPLSEASCLIAVEGQLRMGGWLTLLENELAVKE